MMKTIKTKPVAEGIKALDKAANLSVRAKNAYVRTKKAAVETKQPQNSSPSEYATDKTQNAVQNTTERAAVAASQSVQNVISNAVRGNRKIGETKSSPMIKERQAANTANRLADTGTADRVADTGRGATSNFKTKDTVTTASPKPTNQHTVKATAHAHMSMTALATSSSSTIHKVTEGVSIGITICERIRTSIPSRSQIVAIKRRRNY